MTINLTPEQEEIINRELRAGNFRTAEEVISQALQSLQEASLSVKAITDLGNRREAVREMMNFAEKNHTPLQDISVKDLIHEGHRL
jgi:Arc/MetJ-type ribon-helix-helix transcriptional regulator